MLKQLKYDFSKLVLQKKYQFIIVVVIMSAVFYSALLSKKGLNNIEIVNNGLLTFRPIYWLLCCYMICDVISCDYHYQTLKIIIPCSKSRSSYIVSKVISSASISLLTLLAYLLSTNITSFFLTSDYSCSIQSSSFALLCIGAIVGIFFFESMIALCMIVTESEAATIGMSLGTVIIMLILESIEQISRYLPTMWLSTLPSIAKSKSGPELSVMATFIILSLLLFANTIRVFVKKDLFA